MKNVTSAYPKELTSMVPNLFEDGLSQGKPYG